MGGEREKDRERARSVYFQLHDRLYSNARMRKLIAAADLHLQSNITTQLILIKSYDEFTINIAHISTDMSYE